MTSSTKRSIRNHINQTKTALTKSEDEDADDGDEDVDSDDGDDDEDSNDDEDSGDNGYEDFDDVRR